MTTPVINYYGWDVVYFWCRQILNYFAEFSWQVRVAYLIVILSVITMFTLGTMFFLKMKRINHKQNLLRKCSEKYENAFREIIASKRRYSKYDVELACNCKAEAFRKFNGETYTQLLLKLRTEQHKRTYLPNIQLLCELTGVTNYVKHNLKTNKNAAQTLQVIITLPLVISEGYLATYINHYNARLRHMSHIAYAICTTNNPYQYIVKDLNEDMELWRSMVFHRLLGWLHEKERQMPPLITTAKTIHNESNSSFLIEEVAYWGNEQEIAELPEFFLADQIQCRIAAMKAVGMIYGESKDKHAATPEEIAKIEDQMIETYLQQPTEVRNELIKTVHELKTGRKDKFFEKIYLSAPTKSTAELALTCLYDYSPQSRRQFEQYKNTPINSVSRHLIEQIDSQAQLIEKRRSKITDSQDLQFESAPQSHLFDFTQEDAIDFEQEDMFESPQDDAFDSPQDDATDFSQDDSLDSNKGILD